MKLGVKDQRVLLKCYDRIIRKAIRSWRQGKNNKKRIHAMRTALKRIRTLSGLNNGSCTRDYNAHIKPLSRKLGKVRDLQVSISILRSLDASAPVNNFFKAGTLRKLHQLESKLPKLSKQFDRGMDRISRHLGTVDLKMQTMVIMDALQKAKSDTGREYLHALRKRLQAFIYVLEWSGKSTQTPAASVKKRSQTLQKDLGKWHDLRQLQLLLKELHYSREKMYGDLSALERSKLREVKHQLSKF